MKLKDIDPETWHYALTYSLAALITVGLAMLFWI